MGHALLTTPWHFSASQIETWDQCPRKWAWIHIDKKPKVQKAAAALGDRMHKIFEQFYNESRKCGARVALEGARDEVERVYAVLPHFPDPLTPGLTSEEKWKTPVDPVRGYGWSGRGDIVVRPPGADYIDVHDLKSTSKWVYVKSEAKLENDPQGVLYAWKEFANPAIRRVNLSWNYTRTKEAPAARITKVSFTREEIVSKAIALDAKAQTIYKARASTRTALELAPNLEPDEHGQIPCERFGGCEFQGVCNLSPQQLLRGLNSYGGLPLMNLGNGQPVANGFDVFNVLNTGQLQGPPQAPPQQMQPSFPQQYAPPAPQQYAPPTQVAQFPQPQQLAPQLAPNAYPVATQPAPQLDAGFSDVSRFLTRDERGRITHAPNGLELPPHIINLQQCSLGDGTIVSLTPTDHRVAEALNCHGAIFAQNRGTPIQQINPPEAVHAAPGVPQQVQAAPVEEKKKRGRPKVEAAPAALPAMEAPPAITNPLAIVPPQGQLILLPATSSPPAGFIILGSLAIKQ